MFHNISDLHISNICFYFFPDILPEAIKTNCLRCTEKQRIVTTRTIKRLQKEYPDIWSQLEQRWDPTGVNVKRLLASVNRPRPVSEIPALAERFGDEDENNIGDVTRSPTVSFTVGGSISSTTPLGTSTTTTTTTSSTTRDSSPSTATTARTTTTTSRVMSKPVTARPFNSIGPNLMILNPKIILDKVLYTADAVLNTVSGVFNG